MFSNRKYAWFISAALLVLVFVVSGCSSSGGQVNVGMKSFAFTLDKTSVPAGKVTFHLTNPQGEVTHEMVVIKTDLDAMQLPTNSDKSADESQLTSMGEIEVAAGETKDLTLDLTAGHYVLLCNLPGHYAGGMAANFTVQ